MQTWKAPINTICHYHYYWRHSRGLIWPFIDSNISTLDSVMEEIHKCGWSLINCGKWNLILLDVGWAPGDKRDLDKQSWPFFLMEVTTGRHKVDWEQVCSHPKTLLFTVLLSPMLHIINLEGKNPEAVYLKLV